MAHFHGPADVKSNAAAVVRAKDAAIPITGEATSTDAQAANLHGGQWYFTMHTEKNEGGEIRGLVTMKK